MVMGRRERGRRTGFDERTLNCVAAEKTDDRRRLCSTDSDVATWQFMSQTTSVHSYMVPLAASAQVSNLR